MKKSLKLCSLGMFLAGTLFLNGCSIFGIQIGKKTEEVPVTAAQAPTETVVPVQQTIEEKIVGEWKILYLENQQGETLSFDDLAKLDSPVGGILAQFLDENTRFKFTEDGKLKLSVLSVDYAFEGEDTLRLSGGVLPQSYSMKIAEKDQKVQIQMEDVIIVLEKV